MPDVRSSPAIFQEFREALGIRDPKTISVYVVTMRDFAIWLAMQPGGTPFHLGLLTETVVRGYMNALNLAGCAHWTRSKALSRLRQFCRWVISSTGSAEQASEAQRDRRTRQMVIGYPCNTPLCF